MRHFDQHRVGALTAAAFLLALALGPGAASAAAEQKKVVPPIHIRGTVYKFDDQVPIAGATVGIAELPALSAVSGPDGGYDMMIPGGTKFTPYADAPGHHRIYLQTFVSQGSDLRGVNFQMPTTGIYQLLAAIVSAPLDAQGEIVNCAVVSTFSTEEVRDLDHAGFVAYGAHGVAGATATAEPALPKPIYFNHLVLPDVTRTDSSVDGGVVWPIVPAGVFRFTGSHPTRRFAPFRATCEPGRVVNANPTRGLYELRPGEQVDTSVDASLANARIDQSGKRPLLKLNVDAGEYTAVSATLIAGKSIRARGRTRGYAPGKRSLKLPVAAALRGRRVVAELSVEDGEGNVMTLRRKLQVPPL